MKFHARLLAGWLFCCCLCWPLPVAARPAATHSIILIQDRSALLGRQVEQLHQLIDLLPDDCHLGIGVSGSSELLAPASLTLSRRADLHTTLQAAAAMDQPETTERAWSDLVTRAISSFPQAGQSEQNRLILLQLNGDTSADWTAQIAAMAARRVQTVLLTEQPLQRPHPLARQGGGQQLVSGGNLLPALLQQLGLASGELLQTTLSAGKAVRSFHLDQAVQAISLLVERADLASIGLIAPAGQRLTAESAGFAHCLTTPSYTCLHLTRWPAGAGPFDGDWQLILPEQAQAHLWLVDSVELLGTVSAQAGGRLVTAAVWRNGEQLTKESLGTDRLLLLDQAAEPLLYLNDIGLNGDELAADGIFSGRLPDWLHPLAGTAVLEVQGYVSRRTMLSMPEACPTSPLAAGSSAKLLWPAVFGACAGGYGLVKLRRAPVVHWQLQHRSPGGYRQRFGCGARPLLAGSGQGVDLKLSAATSKRQLRFLVSARDELTLEVLSAQPLTLVNGVRVFLRQSLAAGDLIEVGGDQLLVEYLPNLRQGRRPFRPARQGFGRRWPIK